MTQFLFKSLSKHALLPVKASAGACAYDVHACGIDGGTTAVPPGASMLIGTGLACAIPTGWCIKIFSRSGHGAKHAISLANSTGLVDEDFTGEIMVCLRNDGHHPFMVSNGDRIAQIRFERNEVVELAWTDRLEKTARGASGFGSTGGDGAHIALNFGGCPGCGKMNCVARECPLQAGACTSGQASASTSAMGL